VLALIRGLIVMAIVGILAGCGSMAPPGTPAYKEGWRFGCWQGYDDGGSGPYFGQLLTPPRHAQSPDYQRGWDEAYGECYQRAIMQTFDSGL
jgi:hypothetical protein